MIVVSNTSPLIALAKINQFIIFSKLFKTVLIPQTVSEEFLQNCTEFSRRLGLGEQEALSLAIEKQADILIIDDRKALNEAYEQKLNAVSTRAVLKIAAEKKIISDYQSLEIALKKQNFFLPNY